LEGEGYAPWDALELLVRERVTEVQEKHAIPPQHPPHLAEDAHEPIHVLLRRGL